MGEEQRKRRVTAADIARSLGISRATVGFVLNDTPGQTISPATRGRVLAEAERLGYRPHLAARALASGQSRIVLVVLPDWPIDHALRLHLDEASLALDEAGYSMVTMTPHASGHARPLWETLQPDLVMGLLPFSAEQEALIRSSGTALISPDATPDLGTDLEHARGPELQLRHLAERGHSRVAFAVTADPRLDSLSVERAALATSTAAQLGVELRVDVVDSDTVASSISGWMSGGVTAVAAYNDDIAAIIVGAALRAGIRPPSQLAVIGHDDTPISQLMVPSISTIHVDSVGLGRYFAALALHAVEGTPAPVAPPTTRAVLVVRESS